MRGRHTLAVLCGVLALLVSGCGGSAEPQPLPKPTSGTSPPGSPSPTPPVMPSAAKEKTKAGSVAFVRHYVDLLNVAMTSGDVTALSKVESPQCGSCKSVQDDLKTLYESGGRLEGGTWKISQILGADPAPNNGRNIALVVSFGPQKVVRADPAQSQQLKGGTLPLTVELADTASGWQVAEWTRGR